MRILDKAGDTSSFPTLKEGHFLKIFIGFWILWTLMVATSLTQAWWYQDDFNIYDGTFGHLKVLKDGFYNNRPMLGVYFQLLLFDSPPESNGLNIAFRILQIGGHALAASFLVMLFQKNLRTWVSVAGVLLFLTWGFHIEATVWYAACVYPFGAAFSFAGIWLVSTGLDRQSRFRIAVGMLFAVLSFWSAQTVAPLGILAYVVLCLLEWEQGKLNFWKAVKVVAATFISLIAAAVSMIIMMQINDHSRIVNKPWSERIEWFFNQIGRYFYFPEFYSIWVIMGHGLILLSLIIVLISQGMKGKIPLFRFIVSLLILFGISVGTLSANIASGALFPSFRILYGVPLIGTAIFLLSWNASNWRVSRGCLVFGLIFSIIGYSQISLGAGSELVELYNRDFETYQELEAFAKEHDSDRVLFMDWKHSGPWNTNPYDLEYRYSGFLASILQTDYSNYRVLRYYTELDYVDWWKWEDLRKKYAAEAKRQPRDEPFVFLHKEEENIILMIPR